MPLAIFLEILTVFIVLGIKFTANDFPNKSFKTKFQINNKQRKKRKRKNKSVTILTIKIIYLKRNFFLRTKSKINKTTKQINYLNINKIIKIFCNVSSSSNNKKLNKKNKQN